MPGCPARLQYFLCSREMSGSGPRPDKGGNDMLHGKRTRILTLTLVVLIALAGGQLDGWTWT
jgi:hypothetical protein